MRTEVITCDLCGGVPRDNILATVTIGTNAQHNTLRVQLPLEGVPDVRAGGSLYVRPIDVCTACLVSKPLAIAAQFV